MYPSGAIATFLIHLLNFADFVDILCYVWLRLILGLKKNQTIPNTFLIVVILRIDKHKKKK